MSTLLWWTCEFPGIESKLMTIYSRTDMLPNEPMWYSAQQAYSKNHKPLELFLNPPSVFLKHVLEDNRISMTLQKVILELKYSINNNISINHGMYVKLMPTAVTIFI